MWKVKTYLRKVAVTDSHVLITGETGTGKELAAQYIHRHSTRHTKPLITINCAALPDGLLESELFGYERGAFTGAVSSYAGKLKLADGGTVLFDEIGDMSLYAQAKILRAHRDQGSLSFGRRAKRSLEIFGLSRPPTETWSDKWQRASFAKISIYRLNVARVHLPPLTGAKGRYSGFNRSLCADVFCENWTRDRRYSVTKRWSCCRATSGRATCVN